MGLKPGFKQTEVGVIPDDWEPKRLGNFATFRTGPFGSALHKSDYVLGGVPVVNPMQIVDGKIEPTPSMTVPRSTAEQLSDFELQEGNIVIGRRGEMGRCAVVTRREDGWLCGTGSMVIKLDHSLIPNYVQRQLSSSASVAAIENSSAGSTMVNLNQRALANLAIPVPPTKTEQEVIADALSDADALIDSLERLIDKKRQIKEGAIQELLTGKTRLPGFEVQPGYKSSGVGSIPKDWEVEPLRGLISSLHAGVSVKSVESGQHTSVSGKAILKTSCVSRGMFIPSESKLIAPKDIQRATLSPLADTILISRMNTPALVGECGYVPQDHPDLFLPDRLWMTNHNGSMPHNVRWLSFLLSTPSVSQKIRDAATGTSGSMKNISKNSLLSILIPVVSDPNEQEAIADVLTEMDYEITALEGKLEKARQIKQGMMQELLTGRIRLR